MAISEKQRNDLYTGLSNAIGEANTETLMKAVPLRDLDEVATKRDLQDVEARLGGVEARLGGVEARLGGVEARLLHLEEKVDRMTLVLISGLLALIATLIGVNVYFN